MPIYEQSEIDEHWLLLVIVAVIVLSFLIYLFILTNNIWIILGICIVVVFILMEVLLISEDSDFFDSFSN